MSKHDSIGEERLELQTDPKKDALVSWVMERVDEWVDYRESNYKDKWDEYYRLWRGIWHEVDKTRDSERSRLIVPALQQAIESAVSELEEATFGKGLWFDIVDDQKDPDKADMQALRTQLHEDFELAKVPTAISEVFLNGALYGTGIGKIIIEEVSRKKPASRSGSGGIVEGGVVDYEEYELTLEAIDPRDFAIDPLARSIEDALGCAHIVIKPKHAIYAKQEDGTYFEGDIDGYIDDVDVSGMGEMKERLPEGKVKVIEYAGLVPRDMLPTLDPDEELVPLFDDDKEDDEDSYGYDEDDLVEALVTIANGNILLKATESPYMMNDRPFIAYQHDKIPNRFWGRGIAEKGYNPQKALDAELRARIDAMALAAHPMLAMDATRLPRGFRPVIGPGKSILTNGSPQEVLMPFQLGNINPATFTESGELERMIQMGTGSMDSAAPVGVSPRNSTASGMSMIQSGSIKRSKRTLKNIESNFLRPLITKSAWRYMQFNPERYPVNDYKFLPKTTIGIMAREYEQQQLTNLLAIIPQDSPVFGLVLKGIFDNSSLENKDQLLKALEQMQQPAKPSPEEEQAKQLQQQLQQADLADKQSKVQVAQANAQLTAAKTKTEVTMVSAERAKTEAESILAMARAEAAKVGDQLAAYKHQLDRMSLANDMQQNMMPEAKETGESSKIEALEKRMQEMHEMMNKAPSGPKKVERDNYGRIMSVDGNKVKRNEQGLIEEI